MAEGSPADQEITDDDKLMGIMCYVVGIIAPLIVLLTEARRRRTFQKYHAVQSLGLSLAWFIFSASVYLCTCVLIPIVATATRGIGGTCMALLYFVPLFVWFVVVYYGFQAYQGEYVEVPVLTDFMVQQGWLQRP